MLGFSSYRLSLQYNKRVAKASALSISTLSEKWVQLVNHMDALPEVDYFLRKFDFADDKFSMVHTNLILKMNNFSIFCVEYLWQAGHL